MVTIVSGKRVRRVNVSRKVAPCPRCNKPCKRHSKGVRKIIEVAARSTLPVMLEVTYSKHYCPDCKRHFSLPTDLFAKASMRYSNRVVATAVAMIEFEGMTIEKASEEMWLRHKVEVPPTTLHDWLKTSVCGRKPAKGQKHRQHRQHVA